MTLLIGGFGKTATDLIQKHFSHNNNNTVRVSSHDGLFCAVAHSNMQLDTVTIDNQEGLLLGKIFNKETYEPIREFQKYIQPSILLNNYWGRFSGAMYSPSCKKISLVRDPLGLETLYYMPFQDGILFSTKLSHLVDSLKIKPAIDWHYFAEYLIEKNYLVPQTPFEGIYELLPGIHLKGDLNGTMNQTFEWQIPTERIINEKSIEEMVLDTLKKSTEAWIGNNKKITLQLSGGVDSSSILCLLKHIAPHATIQGIHYNDSKNPASQEIAYAQKIAADCNIPLIEIDFQDAKLFEPLPSDWRPDKPNTGMTSYSSTQKLKDLACNSIIISGQGGDHVFLAPPPEESIADYWLDKGLRGISGITHELSNVYRTSWLALAKTNLKVLKYYYLGQMNHDKDNTQNTMLAPDFAQKMPPTSFYLENVLKNFPPAKAKQIELLYHAVAYADQIDETLVIYPILSLPVVECALKIPTYMTIKDGYNRYYLRKAISRIHSSKVIWRLNKGEVSTSIIKALQKEYDGLVELISSGMLIKHGVLDKQWLESKFDKIRHGDSSDLLPLFRIIGTELWFKQWGLN